MCAVCSSVFVRGEGMGEGMGEGIGEDGIVASNGRVVLDPEA